MTCPTIDGDWSDPVYLNSSGFDPSLFHDDDGRKYLVNMLWDHRPGQNRFAGIVLQEYSPTRAALIGERHLIFTGTPIGFTEAPHLYKRNGYYYLITAEGGTGWGHAVTMARSRDILGPYELHPGRLHPDRAPSSRRARCSGPATPIWSRRRTARPTWCISAAGRCPIAAAARWAARRRSSRCAGATTAGCGRTTARACRQRDVPRRACLPHPFPPAPPRARTSTAGAADRFPVAAIAVARRALQPDGAARSLRLYRPRDDRQPVQAGARRAPPAGALLQRRRRASSARRATSSRWPASSATTTASSSTTST